MPPPCLSSEVTGHRPPEPCTQKSSIFACSSRASSCSDSHVGRKNRTWQNMSTPNEAFSSYLVSTCQSHSLIRPLFGRNFCCFRNPVCNQFMVVHPTHSQGFLHLPSSSPHSHHLFTWDLLGLVSSLCFLFGCSLQNFRIPIGIRRGPKSLHLGPGFFKPHNRYRALGPFSWRVSNLYL